jgi:CRP-like cAMP-binding protein
MATASAMSDGSLMRLEKAGMIRSLLKEPALADLFLRYVLSRNIRIEEDLVDQLFNSSEKRLARLLLLLANFGKEAQPETRDSEDQPGDARRNDRHDSIAGQLLHEQVSQTGLHRI